MIRQRAPDGVDRDGKLVSSKTDSRADRALRWAGYGLAFALMSALAVGAIWLVLVLALDVYARIVEGF